MRPSNTLAVREGTTSTYVGYRNFYDGRGKFKYFIYPDDNWKPKWGKKPLLGTVYADEPFYAVREAYTKGLAPVNYTFGLIALKEKLDEDQLTSRRYN
jgi:hypothetical protein